MKSKGRIQAAVAIIRLLAFTGARKGEIAGLRWSEVDLERSVVIYGWDTSRPGREGCSFRLRLRSRYWPVQCSIEGSPFVFPAASGDESFSGRRKVVAECARRFRRFFELFVHDLRHSFASVGLAR